MEKKINVLVLCSVLIPVCLSAWQTRNCRKQGSFNKWSTEENHWKHSFDKTGPAATFDWDAKNSIRYITFGKLQYMRSDDKMVFQYMDSNRMKPSIWGRKSLLLWGESLEGIPCIQGNRHSNQGQWGKIWDMYTDFWNYHIIPKIGKQ